MSNKADQQQIETVLQQYEVALNAGDIPAILPLYSQDGVLMAQNATAVVGIEAIQGLYEGVFGMIKLDVVFTVHEIEVAGDLAFARTSSNGSQVVVAPDIQSDVYNNELFVLRKVDDAWKIARYCFATANPPS